MVQAPTIPKDPAQEILKKQAEEDKIAAIQKRTGADTLAMLRRFGAGKGLSGAPLGAPLQPLQSMNYAGARR